MVSQPKRRRIDRILQDDYLDQLAEKPLDEVRAMREECLEVETEVSYVRRLAQARIEILEAELERRVSGGSVGDLIAALPKIFADDRPRTSPPQSRLPRHLAPAMDIEWSRGLERLVADSTLVNLPKLPDAELREILAQLREFEQEVSGARRALHAVIDRLEVEIGARHKAGAV